MQLPAGKLFFVLLRLEALEDLLEESISKEIFSLLVFCRGKLPSNTKTVKLTEINGNHRKDDAEGMLIRQTDAL